MYPYQYPWQNMYSAYPMAYRGCYDCPMMCGFENRVNEEEVVGNNVVDAVPDEEARNIEPMGPMTGMGIPMKPVGISSPFLSGMTMKPGMMTQITPVKQDTFSIVLKQLQAEAPEILSALVGLGISVETLRQIVMRIVETAKKEQE